MDKDKSGYLFSSEDLFQLIDITESVKTRLSIIEMIGPRLVDPKSRANDFIGMFRYSEEKKQVEDILKARSQSLVGSVMYSPPTGANLMSGGGRGGGSGAGAGAGENRRGGINGNSTAGRGPGRGMMPSSQGSSHNTPPIEPISLQNLVIDKEGLKNNTDSRVDDSSVDTSPDKKIADISYYFSSDSSIKTISIQDHHELETKEIFTKSNISPLPHKKSLALPIENQSKSSSNVKERSLNNVNNISASPSPEKNSDSWTTLPVSQRRKSYMGDYLPFPSGSPDAANRSASSVTKLFVSPEKLKEPSKLSKQFLSSPSSASIEVITDPVKLKVLKQADPVGIDEGRVFLSYQELIRRNFLKEYSFLYNDTLFTLKDKDLESHLKDDDFIFIFRMTPVNFKLFIVYFFQLLTFFSSFVKDEFKVLPKWKQVNIKKDLKLF